MHALCVEVDSGEAVIARANRHYLPDQIWHITHRCHKKDFLFKFRKDRLCWIEWLSIAKERYGLKVLDYTVTSNHIHLLVLDNHGQEAISRMMQLIEGKTGQVYNRRMNRTGAFWADRYHATAVESGQYLLNCLIYIDLNMVRAGVVSHPSQWDCGGYREIQSIRTETKIIDRQTLSRLLGYSKFSEFQKFHRISIDERIRDVNLLREEAWTDSIAVGSYDYVQSIRASLYDKARRVKITQRNGIYILN